MKFVSPLLKRVVFPCLSQSGFLRRQVKPRDLRVITYHGVLPRGYEPIDPMLDGALVTAEALRRQLRLLRSHYNIVDPGQLFQTGKSAQSIPPGSVLVTCDDGLLNSLTEMLPILQEEQVPCLFFVTGCSASETSHMLWHEELYLMMIRTPAPGLLVKIDPELACADTSLKGDPRSYWWSLVRKLSRMDAVERHEFLNQIRDQLGLREDWRLAYYEDSICRRRFLLLNRAELKKLADAGATVGSHTLSHPILTQMSQEHAWNEITKSRRLLEETLQKQVWAFAYPFGDPTSITKREMQMAKQAGYEWAFSNHDRPLNREDRLAVPRVHVTAAMSLPEFEAHVSGLHETLRRCFLRPAGNLAMTDQASA